jgi:hypothetical protein
MCFSILCISVGNVIAIATCIATTLYLCVTYLILVNTRKEHKENQLLTSKIHSDSLTPYLYLENIEYNLIITSKINETLRVKTISIINENQVQVNSLPTIYNITDLTLKGIVKLKMNNASTNIADTDVRIDGILGNVNMTKFIQPHLAETFLFNVENPLKNISDIESLLNNQMSITIIVSAKGAGISAQDKFKAKFPIKINESNIFINGWTYEERTRKYV